MERILTLRETLAAIEREAREPNHAIEVVATGGSALAFRDVTIADASGAVLFRGISAVVEPGEHVLILGDPRLARTLFKVVAGVWPWGRPGRAAGRCRGKLPAGHPASAGRYAARRPRLS